MDPRNWIEAEVVARTALTSRIVMLELRDRDGSALPVFTAGSHIDVEIAPGLIRQYSLIDGVSDPAHYRIAVLREDESRGGSAAIHDTIRPGRILRIGAPRNNFRLAHSARRSLLYAGGIGITPILCMAERLLQAGADFKLHYGARRAEDAAFLTHIEQRFAGRARFHFSREQNGCKIDPAKDIPAFEEGHHLYVCGPAGFIQAVLDGAGERGWPGDNLHREFFASPEDEDERPAGTFSVKIASTGKILEVPANRSVVEVLVEAGIDLPVSCEQGVCGTCLTGVLDGTPDHRDVFLTDAEHARNDQFTPCCSRALTGLLVLDL